MVYIVIFTHISFFHSSLALGIYYLQTDMLSDTDTMETDLEK